MDEPVPYPSLAEKAAGAALIASGLTILTSIQLMAFTTLPKAIAWTPALLLGLGILNILTLFGCFSARTGPFLRAILLTIASTLTLSGAAVYLTSKLFLSPLVIASPLINLLSSGFLIAVFPSVIQYHTYTQKEAPESQPEPTSWLLKGPALIASLAIALAFYAPRTAWRLVLMAQVLTTGSWPSSAPQLVPQHTDYPYSDSPFAHYVAYEKALLEKTGQTMDSTGILQFADQISEEVAWELLFYTNTTSLETMEKQLWEKNDAQRLPLLIAEKLRDRGVFYHKESLLSNSFDTWTHNDQAEVHLDCDQLVLLFTHIAWRLDLNFEPILSPMHMYLRYNPPQGISTYPITIETTHFRSSDFFIAETWYPGGGDGYSSTPAFRKASGLYAPMTQKDLEDSNIANILVGLSRNSVNIPIEDELKARLPGTRSYLIVNNLYNRLISQAQRFEYLKDTQRARKSALEAAEVRAGYGDLLFQGEPTENLMIVRLLLGNPEELSEWITKTESWYADKLGVKPIHEHSLPPGETYPVYNVNHAEILLIGALTTSNPEEQKIRFDSYISYEYRDRAQLSPPSPALCSVLATLPTFSSHRAAYFCKP